MNENAPDIDCESDVSSVDGRFHEENLLRRRLESLQQENSVLKKEIETCKSKIRALTEQNDALKHQSVSILARAEQEEEYISNTLLKQITELKKEKESLAISLENEEEYLTNELNRKYLQLKQDRDKLEKSLAHEQELQIGRLTRRVKKLEQDVNQKQASLETLRREKVELENALEQEQEALVNRLWKKMEKLEGEKKVLQEQLKITSSAPISGSSSVQNLATASGPEPTAANSGSLMSIPEQTGAAESGAIFDRSQSSRSSLRNVSMAATHGSSSSASLDQSQMFFLADSTSEMASAPMDYTTSGEQVIAHLRSNSGGLLLGHSMSVSDVAGNNSMLGELHVTAANLGPTHTNPSTPNASQQPFARIAASSNSANNIASCAADSTTAPARGDQQLRVAGVANRDTASVSKYIQDLRGEVMGLRQSLYRRQAAQGAFAEEEQSVAEENKKLRRMLQTEIERREAMCRQLSESESSLEMEDERQFNEAASRSHRMRTTSDSASSPPSTDGGFHSATFGPGHAYALRMSSNGYNGEPHQRSSCCRECGQALPSKSASRLPNRPKSSSTPSPVPVIGGIGQRPGQFVHPSAGIVAALTPTTNRVMVSSVIKTPMHVQQSSSGCITPSDDELLSINDPAEFDDDADYEDERSVTPPLLLSSSSSSQQQQQQQQPPK